MGDGEGGGGVTEGYPQGKVGCAWQFNRVWGW